MTFEVERFEWAADDRLELEGRWFGLRGQRFIRPTLEMQVDGRPRRLLALMEHKPWAALDGEDWLAAFEWEGEHGDVAAELAVGTNLTFELPRPGGASPRKAAPKRGTLGTASAKKRTARATTNGAQPAPSTVDDALQTKLADAERARDVAVVEARALRRALDQKERTVRDLRERLDAAQEAAAQPAPAGDSGELDAMRAALDQKDRLVRELWEQLEEARAAVSSAPADRTDERSRELDAAVAARRAAIEVADKRERERDEATAALAGARDEAQTAARAVELAHTERDELRTTARTARHERDAAIKERDDAVARLESTRRERDTAQRARDAERAERPRVDGLAEVVRRRGPRALARSSAERTHDEVLALRVATLAALSVVCLLVAIWILAF